VATHSNQKVIKGYLAMRCQTQGVRDNVRRKFLKLKIWGEISIVSFKYQIKDQYQISKLTLSK
jgi:hypothetical protein